MLGLSDILLFNLDSVYGAPLRDHGCQDVDICLQGGIIKVDRLGRPYVLFGCQKAHVVLSAIAFAFRHLLKFNTSVRLPIVPIMHIGSLET
jgi:hypothetical protein